MSSLSNLNLDIRSAPHLHQPRSSAAIIWITALALLPPLVLRWVMCGAGDFLVFASVLASAFLIQFLFSADRRPSALQTAYHILTAMIFNLLLAPNADLTPAAFCMMAAMLLGVKSFGGFGKNFFHPALLAAALFFTYSQNSSPFIGANEPWTAVLLWTGGLSLAASRWIAWEAILYFWAGVLIAAFGFGHSMLDLLFSPIPALGAFYLLTDPVTSPAVKKGRIIYAFTAGIWFVLAAEYLPERTALTYTLLLMNALSPFIIERFRLKRAKQEK